ncbi:hypothetical protein R4369_40005 [Rhodococcus opacus]|nr:hypothetical protein [Rhodococcus opacus]MDV7090290.1 hypothetical protein [Rhodococcus opacus]
MCGVADEKRGALPPAVRELRGKGERPDAVDPRLQVGQSAAEPDEAGGLLLRQTRRGLLREVVLHPVDPSATAAGRDEDPRGVGVGDGVDAVATAAEQVPQWRAELGPDGLGQTPRATHRNPEGVADRAARAVRGDEVAGVDDSGFAGLDVAQRHLDVGGPAVEADHFGAHRDV